MSASKVTRTGAELMKLRFITEFDNVYELFTVQKSHYNYMKLITPNICIMQQRLIEKSSKI